VKVLHILKSEPDEWVAKFIETLSGGEGAMVVPIYRNCMEPEDEEKCPVNWDRLVADIFSCSRVICWW